MADINQLEETYSFLTEEGSQLEFLFDSSSSFFSMSDTNFGQEYDNNPREIQFVDERGSVEDRFNLIGVELDNRYKVINASSFQITTVN